MVDIRLTGEQAALVDSARKMLARHCPPALVRSLRPPEGSGHSADLWKRVLEAGWLELALTEQGERPNVFELGLVCREAGRALLPTVFYSVLEAASLIDLLARPGQRSDLLDPVLSGATLPTVAIAERAAVHRVDLIGATARRTGRGWLLTAEKLFVRNAETSDIILLGCRTDDGELAFFGAPAADLDISAHATFGHDSQSIVRADGVTVGDDALLGTLGDGAAERAWRGTHTLMAAMTSMDLAGCIEAMLDATVEHLKVRHVFGKPLGSFQAAQHIVADLAIQAKGAELAAMRAAWAVGARPAEHDVAVAKAWTGRSAKAVSVLAHQLHGGMGFVTETDLHLWSDRVVGMDALYGTAPHHLATIAAGLDALAER